MQTYRSKTFNAGTAADLTRLTNEWLEEHDPEIGSIEHQSQSVTNGIVILTIMYLTK